jgi:transposase
MLARSRGRLAFGGRAPAECFARACPPEYGPHTTVHNRFTRWVQRGVCEDLFREVAERKRSTEVQMVDSTHIKAHRSASGGKRGSAHKRLDARAADAIRESTHLQMLRLLSILLSGGQAHSCPVGKRLIRRCKAAQELLVDMAYDSEELRDELDDRCEKVPKSGSRLV